MSLTVTATSALPKGRAANAAAGEAAALPQDAMLFASLLGAEIGQLGGKAQDKATPAAEGEAKMAGDDAKTAAPTVDPAAALAYFQVLPQPVQPQGTGLGLTPRGAGATEGVPGASTDASAESGFLLSALAGKKGGQQKLPADTESPAAFAPQWPATSALAGPHAAARAESAPHVVTLPVPLSDSAWGRAMGEQLIGLVNLKAETAHIQVNPPQLGPIEVSLKIDSNNLAQLQFIVANPIARDAVENSLPRLSQMLAESGIQLGDAQVSSGQGRSQQSFAQQQGRRDGGGVQDEPDALTAIRAARSVLSIFA
ncbi:flagellar hook-length control protein FliK [Crenobacter cavernae]|uniref:Flagellar hook-length control protein-like C-terminal domain-containing protein n=1 Tax=Crenobacter cavernae TaxID=2290923 RepID=A0ABY0FDS2_9NEIS|nr:flagellar hook-length control protein FliK [Crenobacter cavernae]RXZ44153.1 hypothetical protein EBB06_06330 [Crenobacter cavernae]